MRLIIFDVDGTLLDSQHHIVAAQAAAFARHKLPAPTREESLSVVGLSLHEAFEVLVGPDGPIDGLSDSYKDAWLELRSAPDFQEMLYPGAFDLVADLSKQPDTLLGIATGKSQRGMDRIIIGQGWERTFATVQTADTHPSKPDPSMILQTLADTGISPADAVMVGDTTFDIEMAVAARVRAIGVSWGYHPREALVEAGASAVAEDFAALRRLLHVEVSRAA